MTALGSNVAAAQAFTRFGLGGRPDDAVPGDAVGWLRAQLAQPDPTPVAGMPTAADGLGLINAMLSHQAGTSGRSTATAAVVAHFDFEAQTFLANAVTAAAPFRERLVWFWANHFAVMASPYVVSATAGAYVRDAIRPYVTATFADMLQAVMTHAAMITSLNNDQSVGPLSQRALIAAKVGRAALNINENLGRETLELYTVGVGAGYAQADVDAMAYLLTGRTINAKQAPFGAIYDPTSAQPGNQVLMGNTYPGTSAGCSAALQWLGTHPLTYQRLAAKLATHFISDTPAAADVAAIYNALAATGGNLDAAAQALIGLPNAWTPLTKLRTPLDFAVATLRALGVTAATAPSIDPVVSAMGQPTWCPPFPNGWSDLSADWTSPEGVMMRMDWVNQLCGGLTGISPSAIAAASLGPLLSASTAAAVNGAGSPASQLTLLFCSPEWQRR